MRSLQQSRSCALNLLICPTARSFELPHRRACLRRVVGLPRLLLRILTQPQRAMLSSVGRRDLLTGFASALNAPRLLLSLPSSVIGRIAVG